MSEAWVDMECPSCAEYWEANPSDLPAPDESLTCQHCESSFSTSEFLRTQRGLEVVEQFHSP